ncbi:MAG: mechanosensitive ion channel [Gammaproteobacteria bacterium]|nr:mechanosensitive ion channel [Gammaproteobacteria bacterium]
MDEMSKQFGELLEPASSSPLGHALIGLAILILGLLAVNLLCNLLKSMLRKVSPLDEADVGDGKVDLVTPGVSLVKGLLSIFVLIAVLEHFGLTDVLEPLQVMVTKFTAAIPNIIGAGVIGYAGWLIAKIVSQLAGAGLRKLDEQLAERTGNDELKVSGFGSALIFAVILLPIVVAALGVLNIPAISDPASAMIQKLMAAVPNIVGAAIILLVVYAAARFTVFVLTGILAGMNIDALPQRVGLQGLFSDSFTPTQLIGGAIMFFSMVAAATAAVNVLGIEIISEIFGSVLEFGGGLLVGGLILIIGNFLSTVAHDMLIDHGNDGLANIARIAILGLVLAMGLQAMGLADDIVTMAFGFTLGAVALAAAVAFGWGGRDAAKSIADDWARRFTNND